MRRNQRSAEAEAYRWLYKTAQWQRARMAQLRRQPLCERCAKAGRIVPATVCHHRQAHKGDIGLFLDPENLASSCAPCHDKVEQQIERIGYSSEVGADGWPTDPRAPCNRVR